MKNAEIRELTKPELVEKIREEKTALIKLKINHAISPVDNPNLLKEKRRMVARLNTELTARTKQESQN